MSRVLVAGGVDRDIEPPRTVPGERLEHLFEQACDRWPEAVAVDLGDAQLSYAELDGWSNRMARLLRENGIRPGDRVGLLFEQPLGGQVAMLAALKIGASYVPMDVGFPADRIEYILSDAGAAALVTTDPALREVDGLREKAAENGVTVLSCEDLGDVRHHDPARLRDDERGGGAADDLAYVIYTSGSTGRPKGVEIGHPAICNFVRVAADEYGVRSDDRMYQGLTLAFDFSVEEIWTTWLTGATLVPKPAGVTLVGPDLQDFLVERRVTAMCCVPTLLATLEPDLPDLRFLLVSGEACPQSLVDRWYREDRRFLNVYGPTEATVTATWTSLHPDRPVTIGEPLPTYAIVILDRDDPRRALPRGETGEIGIAGIGLARGYLNRPEKTAESFVPDFLDLPHNPPGQIYRTGDLGRVNDDGEIEYQGRIDLQVKIRGYRIEIGEIESVLLGAPGVTQAVVDTYSPRDDVTELVGYYSGRADGLDRDAIRERLRDQLPPYMVPSYLEQLDSIPMTTQDKADRKNLPAPTGGRTSATSEHVEPATDVERGLAAALAEALGTDGVSVTADFFGELGATSLLMAGFTAAVRQDPTLPTVSARDIYRHTTIRELAGNLGPAPSSQDADVAQEPLPRTSGVAHALTGAAQAVLVLLAAFAAAVAVTESYAWVSAGSGWVDVGARGIGVVAALAVALSLLPVVVKWLLLGRVRAATVPLWGVRYLRFWVVRTLVRSSPLRLLAGTPLYTVYLRMLGVRVGRGAVVFTREVPTATDLVRIGERAVIHPEVVLNGYRAVPGELELGPVEVGADAVIGQATVLDVRTRVGDGAQLGHSSALHPGGSVPAGEVWHGSPAEQAGPEADYRTVDPVGSGRVRRTVWSAAVALGALVGAGAVFAAVVALYAWLAPRVPALFGTTAADLASSWQFYLTGLATVVVGYLAVTVLLLAAAVVAPRLLRRIVTPGRTYPLYGVHDLAQRLITSLSNSRFLVLLLGDSSFITGYVRGLGYDLGRMEQTGSNFGTQLRQDSPWLTTVGGGTMISDGLRAMNVDYSHDSFVARPVTLGEHNFVGNDVHVPAGARTGDNVLLATKVMVPTDGPVRSDTGLLGSPPFEIPRSSSDRAVEAPADLRDALRRKNLYNAGTVATVLGLRGLGIALGLAPSAVSIAWWPAFGVVALAPAVLLGLVLLAGWSALLERAVLGFRSLRPRSCSIYDRYFWFHERLWKFYVRPILPGTPFAVWSNRLAGLDVGRRVFDDGCSFPEKSLVRIGDDAVLNARSVVQCHSLEDGRFSSDRVHVGDAVTLGTRAFVHYGASLGDGARLAADSFLMKGEQVGPRESWGGNPAEPRPAHPEPTSPDDDGSPMTDEAFLSRVQRDLHLHDTARATEASVAVLSTLVETLSADETRALADRLPPELGRRVAPGRRGGGQHAVGADD